MTIQGSNARLIIYASIAMITTASSGIMTCDFSNGKEVSLFFLSVLASGLVTIRAYIDSSESQIPKPKITPP